MLRSANGKLVREKERGIGARNDLHLDEETNGVKKKKNIDSLRERNKQLE